MSAVEDIAEPANDAAADAAKDAHAKTARVLFMPSGKRGDFAVGTPVLEAARQLGVYVESVCGGRGICGRCQVDVAGQASSPSMASPLRPKTSPNLAATSSATLKSAI
jgi:ferredoxin